MSDAAPAIRDRAIFLGWIAGLLMAGALVWIFTQPLQSRYLLRAVNRVFIAAGDTRRLAAPLARPAGKAGPMGFWYSMLDSGDSIFVFGIMRDGILVPCGARVSTDGKVEELIPLSGHARQALSSTPPAVLQLYVRRIEAAKQGDRK
ncbi:hypothetical protein AGMMS50293_20240 [Spirochaetia bacterium]|nr:hypothetical protein AGMMS50293_20240 [Spirochaetia bacterium]